jgi:hypothetical protein
MIINRVNVTIANGAAVSDPIEMANYFGNLGMVRVPGAWTGASMGFQVSDALSGIYSPLRDETGGLIEVTGIQTAAAAWYKLPDALRGALFVKLWSETSGSGVNQAADRILTVVVKG